MDVLYHVRLGEDQEVVVALQGLGVLPSARPYDRGPSPVSLWGDGRLGTSSCTMTILLPLDLALSGRCLRDTSCCSGVLGLKSFIGNLDKPLEEKNHLIALSRVLAACQEQSRAGGKWSWPNSHWFFGKRSAASVENYKTALPFYIGSDIAFEV